MTIRKLDLVWADRDVSPQNINLLNHSYGFRTLLASSLEDLQKEPIINSSIVIIDYNFSGNRGLDALQIIKTRKPSLPVIFTSFHGSEEICINAFRLGARDYLRKPLVMEEVVRKIELVTKLDNKERRSNILLETFKSFPLSGCAKLELDMHPGIERAKKFIEDNYRTTIYLSDLSRIACMSKYHFCRCFKARTGVTFTQYLKIMRTREAKRLLKDTSMSITEICFTVGFNDLTYLERVFKGAEGVSPLIYRKNC